MIPILQITDDDDDDDINLPNVYLDFNPSKYHNEWCISALLKNLPNNNNDNTRKKIREIVLLCDSRYDDSDKDFAFWVDNFKSDQYTAMKVVSNNISILHIICKPRKVSTHKHILDTDRSFAIKMDNNNDDDVMKKQQQYHRDDDDVMKKQQHHYQNIINDNMNDPEHLYNPIPTIILDIRLVTGFDDDDSEEEEEEEFNSWDDYYDEWEKEEENLQQQSPLPPPPLPLNDENDDLCVEIINANLSEMDIDRDTDQICEDDEIMNYKSTEKIFRLKYHEIRIYTMTNLDEYNAISNVRRRVNRY